MENFDLINKKLEKIRRTEYSYLWMILEQVFFTFQTAGIKYRLC